MQVHGGGDDTLLVTQQQRHGRGRREPRVRLCPDAAVSFYAPQLEDNLLLTAVLNSLAFDLSCAPNLTGLHLDYHVWEQNPLPPISASLRPAFAKVAFQLIACRNHGTTRTRSRGGLAVAVALAERLRIAVMIDAAVAAIMGLSNPICATLLTACDHTNHTDSRPPKEFWRVDKDPELRHTSMTLVAFHDLQAHIASAGGDQFRQ